MADENDEMQEGQEGQERAEDAGISEDLEKVAEAAEGVAEAAGEAAQAEKPARTLDFLMDVSLEVTVEVGRTRMTVQNLLQLGQGSVVELTKLAGEPLDIFVNGKQVARGEAVIVNEKFGVRLTDIIAPEDRIGELAEV
ncbi:MAG: flagellar motor switch protein FliN [Candidatus Dadabacteria bacterium]|nr:MAG: flagellar motor switch protein FliN [Candidatus Dadabacteria bacterium]